MTVITASMAVASWAGGCNPSKNPAPAAHTTEEAAPEPAASAWVQCRRQQDFTSLLELPEASGATYVPAGEQPHLLLVGDSGQRGQAVALHPGTGALLARVRLPLDPGASDDLEGLSFLPVAGGTLYGLTSSGRMRHWQRRADGTYELTQPAYPIGAPGWGKRAPACASPMRVNCGRNYEGLCLRFDATEMDMAPGACVGFAASKTAGVLYCLVQQGPQGKLAIDPERAIHVAPTGTLSGCHFEPGGAAVWAGSNLMGRNRVVRITGWNDPASARSEELGSVGTGFAEALAMAPGGRLYRFSDTASANSLAAAYQCE